MSAGRVVVAACAGLLLAPSLAAADSRLTLDAGDAVFHSEDPSVANELVVEPRGTDIRFYEPKDPRGISYPVTDCRSGETRGNAVIEVFCTRTAVKSVAVEIGPAEDQVAYRLADVPGTVSGGTGTDAIVTGDAADSLSGEQGNDALNAGAGDDELHGDDGNDRLEGGPGNDGLNGGLGTDVFLAGPGDDTVDSADGLKETVDCGDGTDKGVADTLDELVGCEQVQRREVAPPPDDAGSGEDHVKPVMRVGASSSQRVTKRGRSVRLIVTSTEVGVVQAAAFLDAGGINDALRPAAGPISLAGGAAVLKLTFNARQWRLIRSSFRHRRRARVRVTLSAADAAGNTSAARVVWIKLRR
jgi:Ca2+-binding RTX toxin-like protein